MPETIACYPLFTQPTRPSDQLHNFPAYSTIIYDPATCSMDRLNLSVGQRWQKAEIRLDLGGSGEHIKHRRTRSGCFTCRARRVKCDEARPICERCAKGGRQCTFPDISGTPKSTRTKRKQSSTLQDKSPSPEDTESEAYFSDRQSVDLRYLSAYPLDSPNLAQSAPGSARSQRSLSPAAVPRSGESYSEPRYPLYSHDSRSESILSSLAFDPSVPDTNLSNNTSDQFDINFWLQYHQRNIDFRHYLLKSDTSNFFAGMLPSYAVQNQALLYSVVAFSAFHYFLNERDATGIPDASSTEIFFELHDRAIVSLRESFQENLPPDVFTLLTVLQLATLEEYLGDWANLIEHRKGAYMILESLFSPQSILDTSEGYPIFSWFTRIDLSIAMISGLPTILDAEWYDTALHSCQTQLSQYPENHHWIALSAESQCRRITMQVVNILNARFNGLCDYGSYDNTMMLALKDIEAFWERFSDLRFSPADSDGEVPRGSRAHMDFIYAEVHAIGMLIHHQRSVLYGFDEEYMATQCTAVCDLVGAAVADSGRKGRRTSLLPLQLVLAMAAAFNPLEGLKTFFRSRLHEIEQLGFIYPIPFRILLSKLWDDQTIRFMWTEDQDTTQSSSILAAIKALAEDRNEETSYSNNIQSTQLMRNIFSFADLQA